MGHPEWYNVAGVLYGVSFLLYAGMVLAPKSKLDGIPIWATRLAWIFQTIALLNRWAAVGWGHPPWTTLYELLAFVAWGVIAAHLYIDIRYRTRWVGLMTTLTAFVALTLAAMLPGKAPELLPPVFQSRWLLIHVPAAVLAYGFFALSAFLGFLFLLRDGVRTEALLMGASAVTLCVLPLAGGTFAGSNVFAVPASAIIVNVALAVFALHLAAGVLTEAFVPLPAARKSGKGGKAAAAKAQPVENPGIVRKILRWVFVLGAASLLVLCGVLVWANWGYPGFSLKLVAYRFAGLVWLAGMAVVAALIARYRPKIEAKLAPAPKIDRLTYQAVLAGFPLLTISIVTGGIWAYFAWGRYWGWDAKEVWALATWVVYAIYLHLKARGEGAERRAAVVAVLGFFVAVFAFLGVSLLLPGTHSLLMG